jgi:hypothetical protein
MARIDFDPSTAPEQGEGGFSVMPAGNYVGQIVESDIKATQAGTGEYIAITIEILSDGYKGRKVWHNINHNNPSEKAQAIGQGQLRFLVENAGLARLSDTSQLHFKPVGVRLKVRPAEGQYPEKNEVSGFLPVSEVKGAPVPSAPTGFQPPRAAPQAPATSSPVAAAAAANVPPWAKRA